VRATFAALVALIGMVGLPPAAGAHTIAGLVHDVRDVVTLQAPGTHARITAEGTHLELRRDGARVIEVLDLQGVPALRLDATGAWARKGAPILTVLAVVTGAADPRDAAWLATGDGDVLRFHYPGTHGEALHGWRVPLRVDGRPGAIRGAVERVARPPLAWVAAVVVAVGAGAAAGVAHGRRRLPHLLVAALALAVVAISRGESLATGGRSWGELVAALVALAGLAAAIGLRRDPALERGALAVATILLALPLVGRLAVLRHGAIVTTLDPDVVRALVVAGLAAAAGALAAAARAWWPVSA
jgi:hypothetical protein